jgi:hypothetical protein
MAWKERLRYAVFGERNDGLSDAERAAAQEEGGSLAAELGVGPEIVDHSQAPEHEQWRRDHGVPEISVPTRSVAKALRELDAQERNNNPGTYGTGGSQ